MAFKAKLILAVVCCTWLISSCDSCRCHQSSIFDIIVPIVIIGALIIWESIGLKLEGNIRKKYNADNQYDIGAYDPPFYPELQWPALPFTLAFLYHLFILVFLITSHILYCFGVIDDVNIFGRKLEVREPDSINFSGNYKE